MFVLYVRFFWINVDYLFNKFSGIKIKIYFNFVIYNDQKKRYTRITFFMLNKQM